MKRRRRPRRERKSSQAELSRRCDRLWSEIVRSRGACEMPGKHGGPLQGAHGFSRRYRGTRWLPINGFCLCAAHHVTMTHNPLAWTDFLLEAWGATVYEELKRRAQAVTKPDFDAILSTLTEEAARVLDRATPASSLDLQEL